MIDVLNIVFAWISSLLIVLLSIIYPFRKRMKGKNLAQGYWMRLANRWLRKAHKLMGVLLIGFTFLHCRFSSQSLGFNTGTLCLVLFLLLLLTYIFRKHLKKWMQYHQKLTIILWGILVLHIVLTKIF